MTPRPRGEFVKQESKRLRLDAWLGHMANNRPYTVLAAYVALALVVAAVIIAVFG